MEKESCFVEWIIPKEVLQNHFFLSIFKSGVPVNIRQLAHESLLQKNIKRQKAKRRAPGDISKQMRTVNTVGNYMHARTIPVGNLNFLSSFHLYLEPRKISE